MLVHVASLPICVAINDRARHYRQRCGWCGAMLLDLGPGDLPPVEGIYPTMNSFDAGQYVAVLDDGRRVAILTDDGSPPDACCTKLPPEVTGMVVL